MTTVINVVPLYWSVGPKGYGAFHDATLVPNELIKATLSVAGIGVVNTRNQFDQAFGCFRLGGEYEATAVFARYQHFRERRGSAIARCYWFVPWSDFEAIDRDYEFMFSRISEVHLSDPTQFDTQPKEIIHSRGLNAAVDGFVRGALDHLVQLVQGLCADRQYVVRGVSDLDSQLLLVRAICNLLPYPLYRDVTFLTDSPDIRGVNAGLIFSTSGAQDHMGVVFCRSGDLRQGFEVQPPPGYAKAIQADPYIGRYEELIRYSIDLYGMDAFHNVTLPSLRETTVHAARLSQPRSWVPALDQEIGTKLFQARFERKLVQPDELLYHLDQCGQSLRTIDAEAYLRGIMDFYLTGKMSSEELTRFGVVARKLKSSGAQLCEYVLQHPLLAATEVSRLVKLMDLFVLLTGQPMADGSPSKDKTLAAFLTVLFKRRCGEPEPGIIITLVPYAAYLAPELVGNAVLDLPVQLTADWRTGRWADELRRWLGALAQVDLPPQHRLRLRETLVHVAGGLLAVSLRRDPEDAVVGWLWLVRQNILAQREALTVWPFKGASSSPSGIPLVHAPKGVVIARAVLDAALDGLFDDARTEFRKTIEIFWSATSLDSSAILFRHVTGLPAARSGGLLAGVYQELGDGRLWLRLCRHLTERDPAWLDQQAALTLSKVNSQPADNNDLRGEIRQIVKDVVQQSALLDRSSVPVLCVLAKQHNLPGSFVKLTKSLPTPSERQKALRNWLFEILKTESPKPNLSDAIKLLEAEFAGEPDVLCGLAYSVAQPWTVGQAMPDVLMKSMDRWILGDANSNLDLDSPGFWSLFDHLWAGGVGRYPGMDEIRKHWIRRLVKGSSQELLVARMHKAVGKLPQSGSDHFASLYQATLRNAVDELPWRDYPNPGYNVVVALENRSLYRLAKDTHSVLIERLRRQPSAFAEAALDSLDFVDLIFRQFFQMFPQLPSSLPRLEPSDGKSLQVVCGDILQLVKQRPRYAPRSAFLSLLAKKGPHTRLEEVVQNISDALAGQAKGASGSLPTTYVSGAATKEPLDLRQLREALRLLVEYDVDGVGLPPHLTKEDCSRHYHQCGRILNIMRLSQRTEHGDEPIVSYFVRHIQSALSSQFS